MEQLKMFEFEDDKPFVSTDPAPDLMRDIEPEIEPSEYCLQQWEDFKKNYRLVEI